MTVQAAWVTVTTSPVLIATGGSNGLHVKFYNAGGPTVYVDGGTTVSGTSGFHIGSAEFLTLELESYEDIYAITGSGTATVQVLKGGA